MEEVNILDTIPPDTSFCADPNFILFAFAVVVVFCIGVRLFFTNTQSEFVYDPQMH